ncbi:transposase [Burkholderia mayonis]|uniref:IS4/Tn5 family transposase DNA-binding protein n=1 Tax=Burkholderia mayonis TaxID=1385591 RepID=UPI001CF79B95
MNSLALKASCWTETKFADLAPGEARLNKRARTLTERLVAKPTAGVPQACRAGARRWWAYRFFDDGEAE